MVGDNAAFGGLLADDVEVVVVADDLSVDEGSGRHISGFIAESEESFTVSEVHHDDSDFHLAVEACIDFVFQFFGEVVDNQVDLVSGNGQHEDDKLFGCTFVSVDVSFDALGSYHEHRFVFVVACFGFES